MTASEIQPMEKNQTAPSMKLESQTKVKKIRIKKRKIKAYLVNFLEGSKRISQLEMMKMEVRVKSIL